MATCFACLQNGLFYILLPILGSKLFGINGMWAGFAVSPVLNLACAMLFVYLRFGKDNFPYLLKDMDSDVKVIEGDLTADGAVQLSRCTRDEISSHAYTNTLADRASLFVEEICLTIQEMNKQAKKPVMVELSLFFENDSVLLIERDSGKLFDPTDPDARISGLSGFVLSGLMESHKEKKYLVTTGYNRNMIRFSNK